MNKKEQLGLALAYADAWGGASRTLAFRRIVELLVASRGECDEGLCHRALEALARLRQTVPRIEIEAAAALARQHWPNPSLLAAIGGQPATGKERAAEMPAGPPGRDIAEPRQAVPVRQLTTSRDPAVEDGARQIRSLLDQLRMARRAAGPQLAEMAGEWRWECDSRGRVKWVDGGAPDGLSGARLFELDATDSIWEAFRRRAPFRDVPVQYRQASWRLSGVPVFAPAAGSFVGFRGVALPVAGGAVDDSLAKVAHEVRSPLNAIMGFAQMIEGETLGPAPEEQRRQAGLILRQATRLLGAFDDLNDAARLDHGAWPTAPRELNVGELLERIAARYQPVAATRGAAIAVSCPRDLPEVVADPGSTERALGRLLAATLAMAGEGEMLLLGAARSGDGLRLFITRPQALAELSDEKMTETMPAGGETAGAPLLGFGFALRLVRRLAEAMDGRFLAEPHQFAIVLPVAASEEATFANGDQKA